jgi:glycerol-3-phosphate O-acyltransferase
MSPVDTAIPIKKKYEPILPGTNDWPVVQLSKRRKEFIAEVIKESVQRVKGLTINSHALREEIELTLYQERLRITQNRWKVDPDDEIEYWDSVKSRLVNSATDPQKGKLTEDLLKDIVTRYAHEIAGTFRPSSYRLARKFVTFGFSRLLNASRVKGLGSLWSTEYTLQDKIKITGEIEQLRNLAKIGTVVMVPTHSSNLDSILIGWVIHNLGLPPFIYGAGLNLFNIELLAYFLKSLGAYKVDRRKKNMLYLETLKAYSSIAIRKGCHNLFFPGGTRSRSGQIEQKLKLGLLGTAMEAQRHNFEKYPEGQAKKVFIVPVVLNYHFVLEAPSLINEYLQQKGQERYYVESDEYSSSLKITKFLIKFFTKGSDISASIGRAMDLLGNYVDHQGNSYDKDGRIINTRDYFTYYGHITKDKQREEEYTRMLSQAIVREYHKINTVFSSHLVAYTAFEVLKKRYNKFDLYDLLRLPEDECTLSYDEFKENLEKIRNHIYDLNKKGQIQIDDQINTNLDGLISHGISNLGLYHAKRPLIKTKEGNISTEDLTTLFFYHNRLEGYGLEKYL